MVYHEQALETSNHSTFTAADIKRSRSNEEVIRQPACPCIRFNLEANHVISYHRNEDLTSDERRAAFYTKKDMIAMKQDMNITAQWLVANNCETTGEPDFSIRGMESFVNSDLRRATRFTRRMSAAVVFLEQDMQEGEQEYDPEAIAKVYSVEVAQSIATARRIGIQDARDALQLN